MTQDQTEDPGPIAGILTELQKVIDAKETSAADKLKAITLKIELLGLRPSRGGPDAGGSGGSIPFDESFNEAMADPLIRKRAAKLEEDTHKAIEHVIQKAIRGKP